MSGFTERPAKRAMSVAFCPTAMACMNPVLGSMTVRPSSSVSFSLQMCAPRSANFFNTGS